MALPQIDLLAHGFGVDYTAGTVTAYLPGTSTLPTIAWYEDAAATTPAANPYTLDVSGRAVLYSGSLLKLDVKNSNGVSAPGFPIDNLHFAAYPGIEYIDPTGGTGYLTLEAARTSAGAVGKTVVVTTALTSGQSNLSAAWPTDRSLRVEKGGSINFTSAATFGGGELVINGALNTTVPITISGAARITGYGLITQTTLDANAFIVTANDVEFDGVKIVGNNTKTHAVDTSTTIGYATTCTSSQYAGIFADGTLATKLDHLKIHNCEISGFDFGVSALYNHYMEFTNNTVDDVFVGIRGGTFLNADRNDQSLSYIITGNNITCSYGSRIYSRPIWFNACGGAMLVSDNKLRGGGMSIENTISSTDTANDKRQIITGNDCDTSISGGDVISNNVIDAALCPVGRGPQYGSDIPTDVTIGITPHVNPSFYQAIEQGSPTAIITGNHIRNYSSGIGVKLVNQTICNNSFYHIGFGTTGLNGAVIVQNVDDAANIVCGLIIQGNTFIDLNVPAVNVQWNASTGKLISDIIIDSNVFKTSTQHSLWIKDAYNITVTNNIAINVASAFSSLSVTVLAKGYFSLESGASTEVYYSGNTVTNTLTDDKGMAYMVANQVASIIGYNKANGNILMNLNAPENVTTTFKDDASTTRSYMRLTTGGQITPVGNLTPAYKGEIIQTDADGHFWIGMDSANDTRWFKISA